MKKFFLLALSFLGFANVDSLQLIRNATLKISLNDTTFLVDPMLASKGEYEGFEATPNSNLRNPLTDLPASVEEILKGVDAVILTHTHLDHWDKVAAERIAKNMPIFVQNEADKKLVQEQGFSDVRIAKKGTEFNGVKVHKVKGQHGTKQMYANATLAKNLGETMGVVLESKSKKVYIVGDSILTDEVKNTLQDFKLDVVVLNTGNALIDGFKESIIMSKADVKAVYELTQSKIVAVHMDTLNHCVLSRKDLSDFVAKEKLQKRVFIPKDYESMGF